MKLVSCEYADAHDPGAEVIISYDNLGRPSYLKPEIIFQPTPGYWEGSRIGPFRPRDIDWVAVPAVIRDQLPRELETVEKGTELIVLGYG